MGSLKKAGDDEFVTPNGTTKYGDFSYIPPLSIGDPYEKKTPATGVEGRTKGAQFRSPGPVKKGLHVFGTFDKEFKSLYKDKPYSSTKLQFRALDDSAIRGKGAFRTMFQPSESTGPGSWYGCFSKAPPAVDPRARPDDEDAKNKNKGASHNKPFVSMSSQKKGHYLTPGILIGGKEYTYHPDPIDVKRLEKSGDHEQHKIFRPSGVPKYATDDYIGTGAPKIYTMDERTKELLSKARDKSPMKAETPTRGGKPWCPSSPPKDHSFFSPLTYSPDPFEKRDSRATTAPAPVFRPSSTPKQKATPSVAMMTVRFPRLHTGGATSTNLNVTF